VTSRYYIWIVDSIREVSWPHAFPVAEEVVELIEVVRVSRFPQEVVISIPRLTSCASSRGVAGCYNGGLGTRISPDMYFQWPGNSHIS
jgi:hypothetical protein